MLIGENELRLNEETMRDALAYWLNSEFSGPKYYVLAIEQVGEQFIVTFSDQEPPALDPIAACVAATAPLVSSTPDDVAPLLRNRRKPENNDP